MRIFRPLMAVVHTVFVPVKYEVPVVQPERVVKHVPWWVFVLLALFAMMTAAALFKR